MSSVARLLCAALCLASCGDTVVATQVLVRFDADPATAAMATHMIVTVFSESGEVVEPPDERALGTGSGEVAFPTTVPLEPMNGDSTRRFRIEGVLRDAAGAVVDRQEARAGFVEGERREIRLFFEGTCGACPERSTCFDGSCVWACFDPSELDGPERSAPVACPILDDPRCAPPATPPPQPSTGPSYYVSPDGDDTADGRSAETSWARLAHALSMVGPGDTVVLLDGIYTETLSIQTSGTPDAPLTVRAATDGGAAIDGGGRNTPCRIGSVDDPPVSDVVVEGIRCLNAPPAGSNVVVYVLNTQRVTLRRVTADATQTTTGFQVTGSDQVLLEDVAAYGGISGNLFRTDRSTGTTFRRCFGRFGRPVPTGGNVVTVGNSSDVVVENCVATAFGTRAGQYGFVVSGTDDVADRNRLFGNVCVGDGGGGYILNSETKRIEGNRVSSSVAIGYVTGFYQRGGATLVLDALTLVGRGETSTAFSAGPQAVEPKDADFEMSATITNTSIAAADVGFDISTSPYIGMVAHDFNNLHDVATPHRGPGTAMGPGELAEEPAHDTERYGDGAYLIAPSNLAGRGEDGAQIGAEVLFRYEDGVLTDVPLWPWPMEDRIASEIGHSVTWEDDGGLWRTLCDVYSPP